jgi:hypothetical protein
MQTYDSDGDGFIAGDELDKAVSLKASMATLDTNSDGKVSEEEIVARIESWQKGRVGITVARCFVTMDGRPLDNAAVTFEPEEFLGPAMRAATGVTALDGSTTPIIPKEKRPTADTPAGIQLGFFKIRVSRESGGKETIPAKYNSQTILGQQIAGDDPAVLKHRIEIALSKK